MRYRQTQPRVATAAESSTSSCSPPESTPHELVCRNSLKMAAARLEWDDHLTKVFLDLCIAEKEKLNYNTYKKVLTKPGWQNLYRNFCQQTGKVYDKKQLQNKFNGLKRLYRVWRKLKSAASGCGQDQIAEEEHAATFRKKPLPHQEEMDILFGGSETEGGNMVCAGGIGDRIPSDGSDDNTLAVSDDSVGHSSVGRATQRSRKEQVVDSPPPKRTKSVEHYVERMLKSVLERCRNETSAISREKDEVTKLLRVVEEDGVGQGSDLYFIAAELFRSPVRRAAFRSFHDPQNRIAWLRWTWENCRS